MALRFIVNPRSEEKDMFIKQVIQWFLRRSVQRQLKRHPPFQVVQDQGVVVHEDDDFEYVVFGKQLTKRPKQEED